MFCRAVKAYPVPENCPALGVCWALLPQALRRAACRGEKVFFLYLA